MISNGIKQESAVEGRLLLFLVCAGGRGGGPQAARRRRAHGQSPCRRLRRRACGPPRSRHKLHFRRQLFQQALRQAVHFGKIHRPNVVLLQLVVPPVRLGNGQLRLP